MSLLLSTYLVWLVFFLQFFRLLLSVATRLTINCAFTAGGQLTGGPGS